MARRSLALAGALAAVAALAAGCGDDDEPTVEEAEAELCHQRADLEADLQEASLVDPSTVAVDQVGDAVDALGRRIEDMREVGSIVAEERWDEFTAAVDDLRAAVDDLGNQPVEGALDELRDEAAEVGEAAQAVFDEVEC